MLEKPFKNVELEKTFLGNILTNSSIPKDIDLTENDFYDALNKDCWNAILKHNGESALVINELIKNKTGNINNYLASLYETKFILNIYDVALEIKKYSIRRQALSNCEQYKAGKIDLNSLANELNKLNKTEQLFNPAPANAIKADNVNFNLHFPAGEISIIAGTGGAGKTYMAIYLAMQFCQQNPNKKALLWLTEDAKGTIVSRLNYISKHYGMAIPKNLIIEFESPKPLMEKSYGQIKKTVDFNTTLNFICNYDLIVLDPLANFNPFDTNDNKENRTFLNAFREKIAKTDKSIVFLHHTNKLSMLPLKSLTQTLTHEEIATRIFKIQGAAQIVAAARFVCYFETAGDSNYKKLLSVIKSNVGYVGDVIETLETPHKKEV